MLWHKNRVLYLVAFYAAIAVSSATSAPAGSFLSDRSATTKAIAILKGDPYGNSESQVKANIQQRRLVTDGMTKVCGPVKNPIWEFHVVVDTGKKEQFKNGVIDGYLVLDARTGKIKCTNLPLLD